MCGLGGGCSFGTKTWSGCFGKDIVGHKGGSTLMSPSDPRNRNAQEHGPPLGIPATHCPGATPEGTSMTTTSIPRPNTLHKKKSALVGIGLYALSHGEWTMVAAITCLIERRGWRHA
jgi:hypothetical protein